MQEEKLETAFESEVEDLEILTDYDRYLSGQSAETLEGSTLSVEPIDYTPVIYDVTSVLASVILAGALMIVGFFMGIKLWEVPHK